MASGKYADTESVLDEVIQLFSGSEDQQLIASIRQVERDTKELATRKQAELKETIRALCAHNETQRREVSQPTDTSEIDLLKDDIAQAEAGIARMEGENQELGAQLEGIRQAKMQLAESKARLAEFEQTDVPRARHAISLYANIANIRWDYQDESKVKGFLLSTAAVGEVRCFELDPSQQSENFIVNYLWDKMSV